MKIPFLTTSLSLSLILVYAVAGAIPEQLVFQTHSPKIWQWLSAHFVHISRDHLAWNLITFIILGSIIEQHSTRRWLLSLIFGVVSVDLYLLNYTLPAYAGLSGVLNTLLVIALFQLYQLPSYRNAVILTVVASSTKLIYEWVFATSIFTSLAWPSVPAAHFAGLLGGLAMCFMYGMHRHQINTNNKLTLFSLK